MESAFGSIILACGDHVRVGNRETPRRATKAYLEMTRYYRENIDDILGTDGAITEIQHKACMIEVSEIAISSMCEHHLLPFFGTCSISYLPKKHILGLSKFSRIIDLVGRQFTTQESLTAQLLGIFQKILNCQWIQIKMECQHTCIRIRGAKESDSVTKTEIYTGKK